MASRISVPFFVMILNILVFMSVGVLLQVFLSKRESRIPGLVLPIISFAFSIVVPMLMVVPPRAEGFFVEMFFAFLLCNIPTAILLAIYFACRPRKKSEKRGAVKELDKMNVQDLD